MANTIDRYAKRQMLDYVRLAEPAPTFFREHFFAPSRDIYSPTETVEWDVVKEGSDMARYVNPRIPVRPTEREPFITQEIKTPVIQIARMFTEDTLKQRSPGMTVYEVETAEDRALKLRVEDYDYCLKAIDRRVEQQCVQMMTSGYVAIQGDGVDDYIDFQLPFQMSLTGSACWDQSGVDPMITMEDMYYALAERGYQADELIMSRDVWETLRKNEWIMKMLDIRRYEFGQFNPEKTEEYGGAQYVGTLKAPSLLDLYVYHAGYKNDQNQWAPYLQPGTILMASPESRQNKIVFGAVSIMDKNEEWLSVEGRYVPETFVDREPPRERLKVTSRPIAIPDQYDSWYTATVL